MTRVAGIHPDDFKGQEGNYFLGWNGHGVTYTTMHISAEEVILREEMPAHLVSEIMASVAAFSDQAKRRRPGGHLAGQIPLPVHAAWRREWEQGPKQWGVIWRAFLMQKLLDRDWSRFRVQK